MIEDLMIAPGEREAMMAANETLIDRWLAVVDQVTERSGMSPPCIVHDLLMVDCTPVTPELADRAFCDAVVEGSLTRLTIVVGRIASCATLH